MRYSIRIVLCYDNGGSQRDRGQIFVFHHNAVAGFACTILSTVHIYHNYCLYTFTLTWRVAGAPIPSYVCTCKQKTAAPIILKFDSHTQP